MKLLTFIITNTRPLTFVGSCVLLVVWCAVGRHIRADVAQLLGYLVVPGFVTAVWGFLVADWVKS